MSHLLDPVHCCSALDLDTVSGLTEAILIAAAHVKDDQDKYVALSSSLEDLAKPTKSAYYAKQIAKTLIEARKKHVENFAS